MIGAVPSRPVRAVMARAVPATLLLGATVAASWVGVRGPGIGNGPGPWLHPTWFIIWASQALLAFGVLVAVEWFAPSESRRAMVVMVLLAWVGELLVVAVLLAPIVGELHTLHAPMVWLVATGFGIQPAAAMAGGLVARRRHSDVMGRSKG